VTQTDIDEGGPRTTQECPVAKALMRVIADCLWVSVTWQNCIWKLKNGAVYRAELPKALCGEGQPFCFVIEPVVCPKKAYKGFLFDSNGTVKEVTHYQEEFALLRCSAPKEISIDTLRKRNLTTSERRDPVSYQPDDVIVPNANIGGAMKPNTQHSADDLPVLPLSHADHYHVYTPQTLTFQWGDRVRVN
jgi:hypothetical protein